MEVHDFDFHPDESTVRVFICEDVPRLDNDIFVARARYDNVVLHHYAWTPRRFKVNLTTNTSGEIVEMPPLPGIPSFAFNIDIATLVQRDGRNVFIECRWNNWPGRCKQPPANRLKCPLWIRLLAGFLTGRLLD